MLNNNNFHLMQVIIIKSKIITESKIKMIILKLSIQIDLHLLNKEKIDNHQYLSQI